MFYYHMFYYYYYYRYYYASTNVSEEFELLLPLGLEYK